MKKPCFVGARRVGGLFPCKPTPPSTRLARHWKNIDWHRRAREAHGLVMESPLRDHWFPSTGEAGGWRDGLFNNVPPARHRPYISLFLLWFSQWFNGAHSFHLSIFNRLTGYHGIGGGFNILPCGFIDRLNRLSSNIPATKGRKSDLTTPFDHTQLEMIKILLIIWNMFMKICVQRGLVIAPKDSL